MALNYSIKVFKQYFNFASSHFLVFEDRREPLHGHNYRVRVSGKSKDLNSDMVFDFLDIKPVVKEVCDTLDHRLLLPDSNPNVEITKNETNYIVKALGSTFSFPKEDVLILPMNNISAERLSEYISYEVSKLVKERFKFVFSNLEVEVEETPGQSASFLMEELL